ncbi:putative thymidylate synthase [Pseudomonas phage inbricus]|uniref:Putative thymidylate synthase n=1 Tax=Pseudomonas phage inbricus TaxID=2048976 RepID=A0A2H4P7F8_9CAUD|nr:putative thymidylate synthase [Pseudomonas phage inbricus]ATW58097.1 putative thymidylate synthase [Pseudomonas phage inbricus]
MQIHLLLKHGRITRDEPRAAEVLELSIKVSVARCARVSYNNFEGRRSTVEEDIVLYDKLVGSSPLHASPTEHQATPDEYMLHDGIGFSAGWQQEHLHGNLHGWVQYRKTLAGEFIPG